MGPRETRPREVLLGHALGALAGPAVVLDAELRIADWTEGAEQLVGSTLERGVVAPRVLCGQGEQRPVAEALAAGRAVSAQVVRPTPDGHNRVVHVRATPIEGGDGIEGWLLLLDAEGWSSEGPEAPVVRWGVHTRDAGMKRLLREVERVAQSTSPVLVRGETGSGKELIARAVHAASPRAAGPFRAINCAALPANLLESELFGHVRGAFTGAVRDAPGHFRLAHGGTLFLDEVGELPLELQAKMLRVLEEGSIIPLGGRDPVPVDVRIVAATHRSLRRAVQQGEFRADLMYRLRVVPLFLPPLRDRPADIGLLAWHFVEQRNARGDRHVARIAPAALDALQRYDWPGNVRELDNAIEYAFLMGEGPVLTEAELPPEIRGDERAPSDDASPAHTQDVNRPPNGNGGGAELPAEAKRIANALERANGHRERAARSLGMSRVTLWRKMRHYGLDA